jgi:hypothetical protein
MVENLLRYAPFLRHLSNVLLSSHIMVEANESPKQNPFSTSANYIITFENIELKPEAKEIGERQERELAFQSFTITGQKQQQNFFMALLFHRDFLDTLSPKLCVNVGEKWPLDVALSPSHPLPTTKMLCD